MSTLNKLFRNLRMKELFSHKNTKGFLLILSLIVIMVPLAQAQPKFNTASQTRLLPDYLKRHAHERPPLSTQKRLEHFEEYIRYFTTLSYSRHGVRVNANFLRALISAESAADPYAVSHKNALGLSQITLETGKVAAKELYNMNYDFKYVDENKLKNLQQSDLFDPAINLLICTYLIDKYNSAYNGNLALIISAWNAGPGSVIRYKGYPPYDETLTLIARVNSYYKYYMRFFI